jgi:hypothetical protein
MLSNPQIEMILRCLDMESEFPGHPIEISRVTGGTRRTAESLVNAGVLEYAVCPYDNESLQKSTWVRLKFDRTSCEE